MSSSDPLSLPADASCQIYSFKEDEEVLPAQEDSSADWTIRSGLSLGKTVTYSPLLDSHFDDQSRQQMPQPTLVSSHQDVECTEPARFSQPDVLSASRASQPEEQATQLAGSHTSTVMKTRAPGTAQRARSQLMCAPQEPHPSSEKASNTSALASSQDSQAQQTLHDENDQNPDQQEALGSPLETLFHSGPSSIQPSKDPASESSRPPSGTKIEGICNPGREKIGRSDKGSNSILHTFRIEVMSLQLPGLSGLYSDKRELCWIQCCYSRDSEVKSFILSLRNKLQSLLRSRRVGRPPSEVLFTSSCNVKEYERQKNNHAPNLLSY